MYEVIGTLGLAYHVYAPYSVDKTTTSTCDAEWEELSFSQ